VKNKYLFFDKGLFFFRVHFTTRWGNQCKLGSRKDRRSENDKKGCKNEKQTKLQDLRDQWERKKKEEMGRWVENAH